MTYRQEAEKVLAVWREVERALNQAEPESAEAEELQAEALRLRDKYRTLVGGQGRARRRPFTCRYPGWRCATRGGR